MSNSRQELTWLLRRIQELTLELRSLGQRRGLEVDLMERELERLRWRLAIVARRSAVEMETAA